MNPQYVLRRTHMSLTNYLFIFATAVFMSKAP